MIFWSLGLIIFHGCYVVSRLAAWTMCTMLPSSSCVMRLRRGAHGDAFGGGGVGADLFLQRWWLASHYAVLAAVVLKMLGYMPFAR